MLTKLLRIFQSRAFRTGFLLLALVAAIWAILKYRVEVGEALTRLPLWVVAGATLASFIFVPLTMLSWRVILNATGAPVDRVVARRIFFTSQVAKYLPGGVWNFVAAAEVGRDYAISRRRSVCALLISIIISIVTGMILAGLAVVFGPSGLLSRYWWIVVVVPAGIAVLLPPVLNRLVGLALRLMRREPLETDISWSATVRAAGWAFLSWFVMGVQLWLMLTHVGMTANLSTFMLATGGYALGWTVGFLIFFVPAGVGVREVALGAVLATAAVSQGAILVVVLLSRVFTTLADIVLGVAAAAGMRRATAKHAAPPVETDGSGSR
ncbi:lysylphosphatidylglycerol synthase domain-containing protein [Actinobaculum sp. 352]|uniref:lysylphosphatidylglycerol synthase domain-containing protein n=1 Tax=Actinobaculum sp. 352 TaxID=2490946 RepID=UPI001F49A815|nr:lysylphosphatidylglycerol synthase domain-containing protein [Actinobaculum sp. 352]